MTDRVLTTRFAPSPTGYLHVGGARTALFCWLLARHHGGRFQIRVEDTDQERNRPELVVPILDGLAALGLDADPIPEPEEALELAAGHAFTGRVALQSRRLEAHRRAAEQLVSRGAAFRCAATPEELEAWRADDRARGGTGRYRSPYRDGAPLPDGLPTVIRLRTPLAGEVAFRDHVKGAVVVANEQIEDFVLLRADGTPTYNLACVVDDAWMDVTHVVRGDDHLLNTPKQILLYQALGHPLPEFAHVPMILGADKQRLSKRHGATSVLAFLDGDGYLPDALRNYLVRLGWSHGDQEVFSLAEMIERFELGGIGSSAAVFDPDKLGWLSGVYVRERAPAELALEWARYLAHPERGAERREVPVDAWLVAVVEAFRERAQTLGELTEKTRFLFLDDDAIELPDATAAGVKKWLTPTGVEALERVGAALAAVDPFEAPAIHEALARVAEGFGGKLGVVAQPIRIAVTGTPASPPIDQTLALLGRARTTARIARAVERYAPGRS